MQNDQKADNNSLVLPWIVCGAATLFFFYEFIQGNMFASIASDIMRDYRIQADKMAYLSSIYYLSNVLFLLGSGLILDRFSIKNTLIIAMFFSVLATFTLAYSHSFSTALVCRFVTGIGSAFCFLGPVRLASRWFPPQGMALATGAIITLGMLGGMLAQYPLTKLIACVGWRQAIMDIGILGLVILVIMTLWIQEKPASSKKIPIKMTNKPLHILSAMKKAYLNTQYLRAALFTSLMNMVVAVFGAMMGTLYLEQRLGISSAAASMINGMLFLGIIIGAPLVGWISDKIGLRILPMKMGLFASMLTILTILYLPVSPAMMTFLFFLLGLFTSAQIISYALVAERSPRIMTATAVSVISLLTQGGYLIYQNLFSLLLIHHGKIHWVNNLPIYQLEAYQYAAMILPLGLLIAFVMLLGLKETYCSTQSNLA